MDARDPIEPEGLFHGLRLAPILFGAAADLLTTLLLTVVLLDFFAPELAEGAFTQESADRLSGSLPYLACSLIVGAGCTVFAAFLGARMAGRLFVSHGGWIAITSTLLFALILLLPASDPAATPQPDVPFWYEALSWLLILPAGISGGLLARAAAGGEPGPP